MANPHLPSADDDYWTAPHTMTTASTSQTHTPTATATATATASSPPSPTAIAAAVTLATLSDSRPPTSHGEDADEDHDHEHSGGVLLADWQFYVHDATLPSTYIMEEEEDVLALPQSVMAHFPTGLQLTPSSALDMFDPSDPYYMPSAHAWPPVSMSHMLSSEHLLEPPPTLQETQLHIQDKGSFFPLTSFFHDVVRLKDKERAERIVPGLELIEPPKSITREDLQGDSYDCQGIDWSVRNTTRLHVRAKRVEVETEKLFRTQKEVRKCIPSVPNTNNFFQFRRNNTTHRPFCPHFQLRNVIAASSRNDVFYASGHRVLRTDAEGSPADVVTDLSKRLAPDGCSITTIASAGDVLIAGAFEGEYAITDLSSTYGSSCTFGRTADYAADTKSRIVNHMHLSNSRTTYTPQAVLCSNDHRLRILDCATNTFTHSFLYPAAVNCSATSPNGRMRVVVGDFQETLITNAETGQPFETLNSHTDDAFACAWADDGIHVATAAQDSTIVVWDARHWGKPLTVIRSELSVPRSLRFSPIGSGPRVLVAAEADDFVSIINAQTFESKQLFDYFGPIGGTAFTPDGQSLFIANGERRFGGIIELNRTGWAEKTARTKSWDDVGDEVMTDWVHDYAMNDHERVVGGDMGRQRRPVDLNQLVV
ncbi:hypothetical protein N0V83_004052 [Neocucurbitaria cava]|uniref:WD40 repeat-like protein n=1 Tax=Neocucurbitaria cava TaxID=798079 RepID=A0A9W9CNP4_9PLEO|nr:hypothetical protein N0V83_004052 [Neocucurbitaria cava]